MERRCSQVLLGVFCEWRVDTASQPTSQVHHSLKSEAAELMYLMDDIESNNRVTLVKEIAHIHFTILTDLSLYSNSIQSIEALPRIEMPHLQVLYLHNNHITSVGGLRKAAWADLHTLAIDGNYFGDGKRLTEGCFPHLRQLFVDEEEGNKQNTQYCFPSKMQVHSLEYLFIIKREFHVDSSLLRVLRERWPDVSIY